MPDKILLMKPPTNFIPISWGYVNATLDLAGIPYDFWDTNCPTHPHEYYLERVHQGEYLAAATGGFVYSINWFVDAAQRLKSLAPRMPVVLGGNITRDVRLELLFQHLQLDFVVIGEAETSFPHLLQALAAGSSFEQVPGLAFRRNDGSVSRNTPVRFDLTEQFWMPSYKRIDLQNYLNGYLHHIVPGLGRLLPVMTGRGCKGGCSFCSPTIGHFKPRPVEHILRELEIYEHIYDFESIAFATEIFFNEPEDIEKFCCEYMKLRKRKPWVCSFRMDQPPELLMLMKEAGCVMVNIGLESASQPVLGRLKKGCTIEGFKLAYDAAMRAGLMVDAPFMMTNEDETEADLKRTFDFVIENRIDGGFGLVGTYPGTAIYHRAVKKGLITDEWDYITKNLREVAWSSPAIMDTPYLNISAMEHEELFRTVFSQVRRYYSFLYHEFKANNVTPTIIHSYTVPGPALQGECLRCGKQATLPLSRGSAVQVIEYKFACLRCHQKNFMHFVDMPQTRTYYEELGQNLRQAGKLLLVGTAKNTQDFLLYDIFGIPFTQLVGVLNWPGEPSSKHFYWLPLYHMAELEHVEFDAMLLTDLTPDLAQCLLDMDIPWGNKPIYELAPRRVDWDSV